MLFFFTFIAFSSELECILVATLNLLRLQLYSIYSNGVSPKTAGLDAGSPLLNSLKVRILSLAGSLNTLKTIQHAAQWVLRIGWSILLPSAIERTETLTVLLQNESEKSTAEYRFLTDLLVQSLMSDDKLQSSLKHAIYLESDEYSDCHSLPVLKLINQLLSNNTMLTQAKLNQITSVKYIKKTELNSTVTIRSPSLLLLHRFQRLLLSYVYNLECENQYAAERLLEQYIQNLISLCLSTLTKAYDIIVNRKQNITDILAGDISDTLLHELLIGLATLHCDKATLVLQEHDWNSTFIPVLTILDKINRVLNEVDAQDIDDLSWPGIICRSSQKNTSCIGDDVLIRKCDLDNHVADGGNWIVLNGSIYDVKNYR